MITFREYLEEEKKGSKFPWGAAIGAGLAYTGGGIARAVLKGKYGIHVPHDIVGDAAITTAGALAGDAAQRIFSGVFKGKKKGEPTPQPDPPKGKWNNGESIKKRLPPDPKPMKRERSEEYGRIRTAKEQKRIDQAMREFEMKRASRDGRSAS